MPQPEDRTLQILHATVHCYLSTLQNLADALVQACPPVGAPYRQRLSRLRARLAFDSSVAALEDSSAVTAQELKAYAAKASGYVERHNLALRQGIASLQEIVRTLAQRQEYYGERLRQLAGKIQSPPSAGSADGSLEARVSGLVNCVESMSHETHSLVHRMREEMERLETRLAEAEVTDPVTGLMNRREMEHSIKAVQERGETPVLLLFEFHGDLPDEVAHQVAERLGAQFRHKDLIARWSGSQFLVLFHGKPETARSRAEQVAPWIGGRHVLDSGMTVEMAVDARLVETLDELELASVR